MNSAPVPRWAISFADLVLLLLGCFVLLHAMESARPKAEAGAAPRATGPALHSFRADALFEPSEAVLRPGVRERLQAEGRRFSDRSIALVSRGGGESGGRLDRFELSAARVAAFARALQQGGAGPREIAIAMRPAPAREPQNIVVSAN
jgi:flagellar motor protein MotB